jgi:uncharacterized membrane protein
VAIVLGLAAALLYGGSDFGGGLASRRLGSLPVNVVGSVAATALAWLALAGSGAPAPDGPAVARGLLAGVGGAAGTLALYRGLARGRMSVVGPVAAVGSAAVPVLAGLALGERPGVLPMVGVLIALPAIALVAATGPAGGRVSRTAAFDGIVAGGAFGLMFVALARAGGHAGLWPVAAEQTSSLVLVLAVAVASGAPLRPTPRTAALPALVGASGLVATLLFFYATQFGMLTTVAILTSLYPGVTVLLARVVTGERFTATQQIGLGLCAFAVLAIAAR